MQRQSIYSWHHHGLMTLFQIDNITSCAQKCKPFVNLVNIFALQINCSVDLQGNVEQQQILASCQNSFPMIQLTATAIQVSEVRCSVVNSRNYIDTSCSSSGVGCTHDHHQSNSSYKFGTNDIEFKPRSHSQGL